MRPFPRGWFAPAFSHEIGKGQLVVRRVADREIILFRTESGELAATDPVCPHMGAHLGHGGTVVGETVRCPFHAFRFDTKGACVATGYGTKPPKAHLSTYPVCERLGIVFVHYDEHDAPPGFELPSYDTEEWTPLETHAFRLRGHPQDTTENSVDLGHLAVVHGYENVEQRSELLTEGPYLRASYAMRRPFRVLGRRLHHVDAEFTIHVHGLGFSFVEVEVKKVGLEMRHIVLACPVGPQELELRIAVSVRRLAQTYGSSLLGRLPTRPLERWLAEKGRDGLRHDVSQDFDIWNHKTFVAHPALALGDGPIARYRKWCEQFYAPASSIEAPQTTQGSSVSRPRG